MSVDTKWLPCDVKIEENIDSPDYDGIVLVSGKKPGSNEPEPFKTILCNAAEIDEALAEVGAVLPVNLPAKRLIYSPTGKLNIDYHDVRSFAEASAKGIKRALKAGVRSPLLVLLPDTRFENVEMVTLLGALNALYVPLEVREISASRCKKVSQLGVWSPMSSKDLESIVTLAKALESGKFVARDIGGGDPERMAPPRVEEYVTELFNGSKISVKVISDDDTLIKDYPLFSCVNRASRHIPRHAGRVIFLTYEPENPSEIKDTLLLVGKGVTYDTGGANIKSDMSGMSRDKCGAAACVGFMQTVDILRPSNLKVVAALGVVRNNVGEESYVADEVITAKSNVRVRINNTDAEGRIAMADILYYIKDMALKASNPHIFTIATLTGHAVLSAGLGYTIAVDNAVAKLTNNAEKLQICGEALGEPLEVSRLRREDFQGHEGKYEGDDAFQASMGFKIRSMTQRGHQSPAAFLVKVSGLDKHGRESEQPLKYCHLDIAASAGELTENPTGAPILTLANRFLIPDFQKKNH